VGFFVCGVVVGGGVCRGCVCLFRCGVNLMVILLVVQYTILAFDKQIIVIDASQFIMKDLSKM
jgi:hypothetical protein